MLGAMMYTMHNCEWLMVREVAALVGVLEALGSVNVLWVMNILERRVLTGQGVATCGFLYLSIPELTTGNPIFEPAQDNVALIAVLEALDPPHPEAAAAGRRQLICVANTHIHANPELNDVKLWQACPTPHPRWCAAVAAAVLCHLLLRECGRGLLNGPAELA